MLRKALIAAVALLLLPALLSAYTIVLKDGRRIEAQSRYVIENGLVTFTGTDGRPYQFPLAQVDLIATNRANAPRRGKVWTNDDIERLKGGGAVTVMGSAPAAPASEEPLAEESAAGEEGEEAPPKEETREYWQGRLRPLQEELTQIDQQIQNLRRSEGQAASNAINVLGGNPGVQVEDTLRRLEKHRTEIQQQIAALQEEARRKGVPPGWVR